VGEIADRLTGDPAGTLFPGGRIDRHRPPAAFWHPAWPGVKMAIRK
jgi:hypothetical protein